MYIYIYIYIRVYTLCAMRYGAHMKSHIMYTHVITSKGAVWLPIRVSPRVQSYSTSLYESFVRSTKNSLTLHGCLQGASSSAYRAHSSICANIWDMIAGRIIECLQGASSSAASIMGVNQWVSIRHDSSICANIWDMTPTYMCMLCAT